jgi:RHS repeat-associated protein
VHGSNESKTDFDVFLDDLNITHTKGKVLQEDHYYPFGASISALSSTAPLSKPNHYKLSGNEEQVDFDWNVYDFNARTYDPILGRFMQVDPMTDEREWINPYNYVQNNPLLRVDPTGWIGLRRKTVKSIGMRMQHHRKLRKKEKST